MRPWHVALLGGLIGGGAALAVLVPKTIKHLEQRGVVLEAQMQNASASGALATRVRGLRARLDAHADQLAQAAAAKHLETQYGITDERMRNLDALARRFGVA